MSRELTEATEAEKMQKQRRDDRAEELDAMRTAFNALDKLPEPVQRRAMTWLASALRADIYADEVPF